MTLLKKSFYHKSPESLAYNLLGKVIATPNNKVIITETEAYGGSKDTASHARFGKTERTKVMYETTGHAYVYLIYGIHHMLNVTANASNKPGAVLIRAGRWLNDDFHKKDINGPGKLTKALHITVTDHHGSDLTKKTSIWLEDHAINFSDDKIEQTPRIGIDYATTAWRNKKWRFLFDNRK